MKNNKNKPSYNEASKMFDIIDPYLYEDHNNGQEQNKYVEYYILEYWNDEEFSRLELKN